MKALIVYCSNYKNNTEKIAHVLGDRINCEIINIKDIKVLNLKDYDLIGFGSGVYKENLSTEIFRLVDKLNLESKKVFVFSTSGVGMKFYNNSLIKLLESKGATNIGSFACKGSFNAKEFTNVKIFDLIGRLSQGHPNNKDFKMAESFIDELI